MKKAYKKKAALQLGLINMSGSHCCLKPYNWGLLVKKRIKKDTRLPQRAAQTNGIYLILLSHSYMFRSVLYFYYFAHRWMLNS